MFEYIEDKNASEKYRIEYADGIQNYLKKRYEECKKKRDVYIRGIKDHEEEYRADFYKMLGEPLTDYQPSDSTFYKQEILFSNKSYTISRVSIPIMDEFDLTGLLFIHNDSQKRPFVISQHGGGGTPERCSGILKDGTTNYHDMSERVFNLGANVFAPQFLIWEIEQYGAPYDRGVTDAAFQQTDSSICAIEIYALRRALDVFCNCGIADVNHIGMIGLSYGGFYALYAAAAEPRIKATVSCSYFYDRSVYVKPEWAWTNRAEKFFDAEVALLVYPRKLWMAVGDKDPLYVLDNVLNENERLKQLSNELYGTQNFINLMVFNGTHEFIKNDTTLHKFIDEIKYK